jgi:hypothetical protein
VALTPGPSPNEKNGRGEMALTPGPSPNGKNGDSPHPRPLSQWKEWERGDLIFKDDRYVETGLFEDSAGG